MEIPFVISWICSHTPYVLLFSSTIFGEAHNLYVNVLYKDKPIGMVWLPIGHKRTKTNQRPAPPRSKLVYVEEKCNYILIGP